VLAVKDLVSWHDVIQRKRSFCQENAVLLMKWLGVTSVMPMVCGSTLALPTFILFFFLCFFPSSA